MRTSLQRSSLLGQHAAVAAPQTAAAGRHGFGVLELIVTVLVMGMMTLGLQTIVSALLDRAARTATETRLNTAEDALAVFVANYGYLPCPASWPSEDMATQSDRDRVWTGQPDRTRCLAAGALPWTVLGLARAEVIDGWGRYFTYKPALRLTHPDVGGQVVIGNPEQDGTRPLTCDPTGAVYRLQRGDGVIYGSGYTPFHGSASPSSPAFALVSHGPNGLGGLSADSLVPHLPAGRSPTEAERLVFSPSASADAHAGDPLGVGGTVMADLRPSASGDVFDDYVRWLAVAPLLHRSGCR